MPGDYSRKIFDPKKHYSGVLMQQGRVQLDADGNEQLDIHQHRLHTETTDVIGLCGVPIRGNGFKIGSATGGLDLTISPGRMYVGGLMCELEEPGTTYTRQPYYPKPAHTTQVTSPPASPPGSSLQLALANGSYLVYIDAWQREITALDDSRIREVALGRPDTTTRLQTVWQVRLLPLFVSSPPTRQPVDLSCQTRLVEFERLIAQKTGLMNARTKPAENQKDPCLLPPTAGYQRLENQLYRVQVHTGGDLNTATFKWSRDNATVESTIENISTNVITVADIGKDEFLGFAGGQWVEIVDEESELNSSPRPLVQIDSVDPNTREITMKTSVAALAGLKKAKLRRWDQFATSANATGVKMNLAPWIDLEGGVQTNFSNGTYQSGDYWLIPARTATGEIEWPPFEVPNASPVPQPPVGTQHYYCRLAIISVVRNVINIIDDCRPLFPPLTRLTQLHYVSGDGQEGPPGQQLPFPLQVGVANGSFPVADARVLFRIITRGSGALISGTTTAASVVVRTGADGVAECGWRLDATANNQRVEATLIDHTTLPVRFNAVFQQAGNQGGVHIRGVRLESGELRNDTDVSFEDLSRGIRIDCDDNINPFSIVRPTCFVTIEMPFPFNNVDRELWNNAVIGFQPLILSADVGVDDNFILWRPGRETRGFLRQLSILMTELRRGERVLTHLTLKGNFIWSDRDRDLYLDGEAFGFQDNENRNIDIRFESGNGQRGGDFEMWFWLLAEAAPAPNIRVVPDNLDFRNVVTPGGLPTLTAMVSNIGNAPLVVSSMSIENPSFRFTGTPTTFTLPTGAQQPVTIVYRTTATVEQNGTLSIVSNDPDQPTFNVPMIGAGLQIGAPNIQVEPAVMNFGIVSFNGTTTTAIVRNLGNAPLAVSSITSNLALFSVISPTGPFTVPAGGQQIVTVRFLPNQTGTRTAILTVNSNDPDQPAVPINATGVGRG
jgi:hypothetical protein